ncbi:hypothetical protein OPQ81_008371 [Rhizoctonia solani]|nr:hypothetical protein OPQ81_008371 [Rhizoctonia solani]
MEEAMPSLRRFIGSSPIILALLKSKLVGQLEVLDIVIEESLNDGVLSDVLQQLDEFTLAKLSCLRGLKVSTYKIETYHRIEDVIPVLGRLGSVAPALEELVISVFQLPTRDIKESLLGLITQLPNLRRLALTEEWLRMLDNFPRAESFSESARALCPGLLIVDNPEFSPVLS